MYHTSMISWLKGKALRLGVMSNPVQSLIRDGIQKLIYRDIMQTALPNTPKQVLEDKYAMATAIMESASNAFDRGIIGDKAKERLINILFKKGFLKENERHESFKEEHGIYPPGFLVISPTMNCNLSCRGCYAGSSSANLATLPIEISDWICRQKEELWGSHFTVISGGEPFVYKSRGKTLFDLFENHPDQYFLVYTNGTLLNRENAERLAELGNVTPAVSVEGFEKETDERRGRGVYKKILKAFENLREAGVPFGISTTAFKNNAEVISSDEFVEFYFDKQGAIYQWIFQYMPIGRGRLLKNMLTPEQRMYLYEDTWKRIRKDKRFIADFWNCGTVSDGCIAAGGGTGDGYLYIESNGIIAPCVFNPFSTHNAKDIYRTGGNLNEAYFSPFFKKIREWQREYFHNRPRGEHGNLIAPCIIRDHHADMRKIIEDMKAAPLDQYAAEALKDKDYYEGMVKFDEELIEVSNPYWNAGYLKKEVEQPRGRNAGRV